MDYIIRKLRQSEAKVLDISDLQKLLFSASFVK